MIGEILFSLYMSIMGNKYVQGYMQDMYNLVQKLNSENVNIVQYVRDPRFQVFDVNKLREMEKKIDLTDPKQHRFMTEKSINDSLKFMEDYKEWLDKAEKSFGVDREYITAFLNIESDFGNNCGHTPVINGLISHYLFTERKDLFYYYIKESVKVVEEQEIRDVFEWKGSYAGASTPSQLMPDNVRKYGIDFNEDGYRFDDIADGIGSCAKLLGVNGFRENKRKAIYKYNPRDNFVDAVEMHAETLKSITKNKFLKRNAPDP